MNHTDGPAEVPAALSPERLAEIVAREQAAYPGPWRWRGNTEARHLRLQSPHGGGMTVMDFVRWGMQGAQPRFGIDYIMHNAADLVEYEVAAWSKDIYRKDVSDVLHPDAQFLAHAREDVPALLAEVDRLRAELAAARELAGLATEYRVPCPNGTWLLVRRSPQGDRWSVGGGLLRVLEPGGWGFAPDLPDAELYCWPTAVTAIAAARRALAGGEPR